MGYGKNLENEIKIRNLTVKKVADKTGISPTTLYSAIQRDSPVSYSNAIKIYRVLHPVIDMRSICKDVPADDKTLPRTSLSEYLKVGEKMKLARKKAKLKLSDVASNLNLSTQRYKDYEEGFSDPHMEILLPFLDMVNISLEELLGFQKKEKKEKPKYQVQYDNVDYIIHDITHDNISLETAFTKCKDGKELGSLVRRLAAIGLLDEKRYNTIMENLYNEGALDRFK